MYEYVFFHKALAEQFLAEARKSDPAARLLREDPAWEVHVSEEISDQAEAALSARYDQLFDQDRDRYAEQQAGQEAGYHAASVELTLGDGRRVYAQLDPLILDKVTNALTHAEWRQLLADIVQTVENPDERSVCQRMRSSEN